MFSRKAVRVTRAKPQGAATDTQVHAAGGVRRRSDLGCGFAECTSCLSKAHGGYSPVLDGTAVVAVPDASVFLHHMDVLESPLVANIVVLSSVLEEASRRNRGVGVRVQKLLTDPTKRCFVFADNHHEATAITVKDGEAAEARAMRAAMATVAWYRSHCANEQLAARVTLVSAVAPGGEAAPQTATDEVPAAVSLRQYVAIALGADCPLLDRLTEVEEAAAAGLSPAPGDGTGPRQQVHLPPAELAAGVQAGALLKGKFKASDGSCFFGEIRGAFGGGVERILLAGRGAVNRAVHGDVVAVQMLPVDEWRAPRGLRRSPVGLERDEALKQGFTPTGRVSGVLEMNRRAYCGSIDLGDSARAAELSGSVSVLVQPKSGRIPRIRIRTQQAASLRDKRLTVVIDDWPVESAYPVGHYVDVLGKIGDRDTEATVILMENDIPHYDFSQAVYDCLPKGAWAVEPAEEITRRDVRDLCVCSVDPLGCRDIDDALHYRVLPNGNVEVGVHIADVSHFVPEGCAMDEEAAKRSTSVYLVDRRINMLPQLLTENLCSLVGNEDRYAFSIIWEFRGQTMEVVDEWFGKTIIRSRSALYYGDAQAMIDDAADQSELTVSLRGLLRLSRKLKKARDDAGALTLASQEFKFKIDNEHNTATDMQVYQTFETNSMIEEWMLYANVAAAKKIYQAFPKAAMLRRHQPPAEHAFEELNKALLGKGHPPLDGSSSKGLNESLNRCQDIKDPFINRLVRILVTRCLRQAQYFCSAAVSYEEFLHYGLAMPIYTHFTSPIRRFADVVVHRQLAAITGAAGFDAARNTVERLEAIAENINYRHEQAQRAGRDSQNLFTGFFLHTLDKGKPQIEVGYVTSVSETHVGVLVSKYGQEGRMAVDEAPAGLAAFDMVAVSMKVLREGDVCSAKLAYELLDKDHPEGRVLLEEARAAKEKEGRGGAIRKVATRDTEHGAALAETAGKKPRKE